MLDRVAIYKEKSELLKQKIKKAMKYPATVIVVAMIVTIILMVKVFPFSKIYLVHLAQITCIYPNGGKYVEMDARILVYYDYCDWCMIAAFLEENVVKSFVMA
jgi:hypothetical protein